MNYPLKQGKTPVECKCKRGNGRLTRDDTKYMYCCNEQCPVIGTKYMCTACCAACYCSFECQRKDWPFHKKECSPYLIVEIHQVKHYHPNPRSLYQETISEIIPIENMGFCSIGEMEPLSRRYRINWALKSIREARCAIHFKEYLRILEELAKRVPIVFRRLAFNDDNVHLGNLKTCHIKELCLDWGAKVKDWDKFLLDIHAIKPERIVFDLKKYSERHLKLIDIAIELKFCSWPDLKMNVAEIDDARKKRKLYAVRLLLCAARIKNAQSPFYYDSFPAEMFATVLSFVEKAIME